jgi:hypoxanthine-guanine phosphoribosyltransferase
MNCNKSIQKVLLGSEVIKQKITELGREISTDYAGKDLLLFVC